MERLYNEIKEKRARRLLQELNKVYNVTKDNYVNIPRKGFKTMLGVPSHTFYIIRSNFLDMKKGNNKLGIYNSYKWTSIKPNIYMARKLNEEWYKSHKFKNEKQKNITELEHNLFTQQEEVKPIEQPKKQGARQVGRPKKQVITEPTKKEFNLFWGLIKIKY